MPGAFGTSKSPSVRVTARRAHGCFACHIAFVLVLVVLLLGFLLVPGRPFGWSRVFRNRRPPGPLGDRARRPENKRIGALDTTGPGKDVTDLPDWVDGSHQRDD